MICCLITLNVMFFTISSFGEAGTASDTTETLQNQPEQQKSLNVVQLKDKKIIKSFDMKQLRTKAATGTGVYFTGLALNYTIAFVAAANANDIQDDGFI